MTHVSTVHKYNNHPVIYKYCKYWQYTQIGTNTGTVLPGWYNTGTVFPDWYQYCDSIPRLVPTLGQYTQIGTNNRTVFPDWYQHWDSIPRLVPPSFSLHLPN